MTKIPDYLIRYTLDEVPNDPCPYWLNDLAGVNPPIGVTDKEAAEQLLHIRNNDHMYIVGYEQGLTMEAPPNGHLQFNEYMKGHHDGYTVTQEDRKTYTKQLMAKYPCADPEGKRWQRHIPYNRISIWLTANEEDVIQTVLPHIFRHIAAIGGAIDALPPGPAIDVEPSVLTDILS